MTHFVSEDDILFKNRVESCQFPVPQFDHRAHLRLAYVYLVENPNVETAVSNMRDALIGLLTHIGIDPMVKYHETVTEAWILAVHHFMSRSAGADSAEGFIDQNPILLDSKILLSHYSEDVLFSDEARRAFVEPNLAPIPR